MGWLEKQSMASRAGYYISQVSQSDRLWMRGAREKRASVLLGAAPSWIELDSHASESHAPIFRLAANVLSQIASLGAQGLYLGPVSENQDLWLDDGLSAANGKNPDFAASLDFDSNAGTEEDFERLAENAEKMGIELGASLLSPATGRGPDFLLQARNATGHTGLYAMLMAPHESWPYLPQATQEWDCKPLHSETVARLADMNILPAALHRDKMPGTGQAGWAATGPVTGTDGLQRRWLYRFETSPAYPVMLWQDPSGLAKKIFSAAVIRQTGIEGIPLSGIHIQPLLGLDPVVTGENTDETVPFSTGLEALNEISGEIHRYGGWALQIDPVPAAVLVQVLNGNADFCRDDITYGLVAYGLLLNDAAPLRELYGQWLAKGLDISRLARGFGSGQGVRPGILPDLPEARSFWEMAEKGAKDANIPLENLIENFAAATHLDISRARNMLESFFLAWNAGLPGLCFTGSRHLDSLRDDALANEYAPGLKSLLMARKDTGLASGKLCAVSGSKSAIGVISQLPSGAYWLLGGNFSDKNNTLRMDLPRACGKARDVSTGRDLSENLESGGHKFVLDLDGYEARNVVFSWD